MRQSSDEEEEEEQQCQPTVSHDHAASRLVKSPLLLQKPKTPMSNLLCKTENRKLMQERVGRTMASLIRGH